jgi:hypothetical protein
VIGIVTPGGGLMKSGALKRDCNPGDKNVLQTRYTEAIDVEKA